MENFLHFPYIWVAGALISAPIIIHLINRLRFKRIRWAAMEFLLKAQKRNRRRLIIEQLILLALRCLLVAMVGLLVMCFTGFSLAEGWGNKTPLHIVLLDDSLSMNDEFKTGENTMRTSFDLAKNDILLDKIVKGIRGSTAGDKLIILPLSKVGGADKLKVYEKLNTESLYKELKDDVEQLQATKLHLKLVDGVNHINKMTEDLPEAGLHNDITLHVLSDFRNRDWSLADGGGLHQKIVDFSKNRKAKVHLIDTATPDRVGNQGPAPLCHDNIGILDFRPSTRIVGKDMRVAFNITVANYSDRRTKVNVIICRDDTGAEQPQVDFNPILPLEFKEGRGTISASFVMQFEAKGGGNYFASISAHLESEARGKLDNDGLPQDNVAHAFVEVRDQVPVLIIDGEGKSGREEDKVGKDSFFLKEAFLSVPDSRFKVEFGDMLAGTGGIPNKALERPDLRNFAGIILANVRDLTPKQLTNLENYVADGGGLGIFLGPQVSVPYYNKNLYKNGNGLFPVKLQEPYFPPPVEKALDVEPTGAPMLLLREDLFPNFAQYPIFGAFFEEKGRRDALNYLPIKRYFRAAGRSQSANVLELATLPSEKAITYFGKPVQDIVNDRIPKILLSGEDNEFAKYKKAFARHAVILQKLVEPGSEKKPYYLAEALTEMLKDKGKENQEADFPDLEKFWNNSDPKIRSLKAEVESLRDEVKYGDPFVMTRTFGKGKVVAVMTTAGKAWTDWPGGSIGTLTYPPFIWEMQNYLASQGSETNLTVGTPVEIKVETEPYKLGTRRLKMVRTFHKAIRTKPAEIKIDSEQSVEEKNGVLHFVYPKNYEPGLYVANLVYADGDKNDKPLASWAHVFNVDTAHEGPLQRVSSDDIKNGIIDKAEKDKISFGGATNPDVDLVPRRSNFSESPWLFLIFLAVLILEQALAVHLSFHLKGGENQAIAPAAQPRSAAA